MTAWERWALHALAVVVSLTGVAYGIMKYILVPADPFAVINHPWQPTMLALHIVAAPLLVLVIGMIVRSHIIPKLVTGGENRRSGYAAFAAFLVMTMSGYLLQVSVGPATARVALWTHLVSSTLFVITFIGHLVGGIRLRVAKRRKGGVAVRPAAA